MRMCRVHLSVRTEGLKAFQNGYGVIVWTGENDTDENDKCGRKSFWKRSKTAPFSSENGLVWTGPEAGEMRTPRLLSAISFFSLPDVITHANAWMCKLQTECNHYLYRTIWSLLSYPSRRYTLKHKGRINIFIKIKLIYSIDKSHLFCHSVTFVQRIWNEIDFESALGALIYSLEQLNFLL